MIFVVDELPRYCPGCGEPILYPHQDQEEEFFNSISCSCVHCGAGYVYADADLIRQLADRLGSDFSKYH